MLRALALLEKPIVLRQALEAPAKSHSFG